MGETAAGETISTRAAKGTRSEEPKTKGGDSRGASRQGPKQLQQQSTLSPNASSGGRRARGTPKSGTQDGHHRIATGGSGGGLCVPKRDRRGQQHIQQDQTDLSKMFSPSCEGQGAGAAPTKAHEGGQGNNKEATGAETEQEVTPRQPQDAQ